MLKIIQIFIVTCFLSKGVSAEELPQTVESSDKFQVLTSSLVVHEEPSPFSEVQKLVFKGHVVEKQGDIVANQWLQIGPSSWIEYHFLMPLSPVQLESTGLFD